jgi:hypothetical protein
LFILEKGTVANSLFLNFCSTTGGTEEGQGQLSSCTQVILWQPREKVPQPEETYKRPDTTIIYTVYTYLYQEGEPELSDTAWDNTRQEG